MMVEIQGNPDNQELVEIYLISLTKKLGLSARKTGEIIVKFTKKMPNGFGVTVSRANPKLLYANLEDVNLSKIFLLYFSIFLKFLSFRYNDDKTK